MTDGGVARAKFREDYAVFVYQVLGADEDGLRTLLSTFMGDPTISISVLLDRMTLRDGTVDGWVLAEIRAGRQEITDAIDRCLRESPRSAIGLTGNEARRAVDMARDLLRGDRYFGLFRAVGTDGLHTLFVGN